MMKKFILRQTNGNQSHLICTINFMIRSVLKIFSLYSFITQLPSTFHKHSPRGFIQIHENLKAGKITSWMREICYGKLKSQVPADYHSRACAHR